MSGDGWHEGAEPPDPAPPEREPSGVDPAEILGHEEALPEGGEHDFEPDVEHLHRPIFRETRGPLEGREPTPWWVWALSALALFWGGWYLGHHGGTFNNAVHLAYFHPLEFVRSEEAKQTTTAIADPVKAGQSIYTARCQACHQATGRGVAGTFPPLIGSEWVTGPPERLILILLHGLQGPVTVAGAPYNGAMPAWETVLNDAEMAALATFLRQWETNRAPPVEPALVRALRDATAARTTPWTVPELEDAVKSPAVHEAVGGAARGTAGGTPPGGTAP
jgi:mono/diheme cytochrome c family protein